MLYIFDPISKSRMFDGFRVILAVPELSNILLVSKEAAK